MGKFASKDTESIMLFVCLPHSDFSLLSSQRYSSAILFTYLISFSVSSPRRCDFKPSCYHFNFPGNSLSCHIAFFFFFQNIVSTSTDSSCQADAYPIEESEHTYLSTEKNLKIRHRSLAQAI